MFILSVKHLIPALSCAYLHLIGVCSVIYLRGPSLVYWAYPTMVGTYFILPPARALLFSALQPQLYLAPIISK